MATSVGLGAFAKRMVVIAKSFGEGVEKRVRRAAIAADTTAVTLTPVDTGRAKANWIVSIGELADVIVGEPASPESAESTALAQGQSEIATWNLKSGTIFISNGLPYIEELDNGSSEQAPAGFSLQALESARRQLQRTKVLGDR